MERAVWSDSLDKSLDPQMTLVGGGWRGAGESAMERSAPLSSRVITVVRFKGAYTVTSRRPPAKVGPGKEAWVGKTQ